MSPRPALARTKILDVSLDLIRSQGLAATSVDDLCHAAGVTKGAFFHHFASKEALAVASARHWGATTGAFFAAADYHRHPDPVDRVLAYLDLRASLIGDDPAAYSCVAGTMAQEAFARSPAVRDACGTMIDDHVLTLQPDFQAAIDRYAPGSGLSAHGIATFAMVVIQGAFVVSKAVDDPQIVLDAIEHVRRYVRCLFAHDKEQRHD